VDELVQGGMGDVGEIGGEEAWEAEYHQTADVGFDCESDGYAPFHDDESFLVQIQILQTFFLNILEKCTKSARDRNAAPMYRNLCNSQSVVY
jgi:hypothetical protein